MAYVAVSGGEQAIEASLALLRASLARSYHDLSLSALVAALPELIDQVMGESSLYDPRLAALALKQGGGSVEEAVFLLRAYRSTLERPYTSRVIETSQMLVTRRISAAFKDIPGGQILGITRDYSHRLLDFSLAEPPDTGAPLASDDTTPDDIPPDASACGFAELPKVSTYLAEQGLLTPPAPDDTQPRDITMEPLSFPAPRSIRLQALARGMTQGVMALGYAAIRGFGPAHPTVGELRCGQLEVLIDHPFQTQSAHSAEEDAYYVGSLAVTECESLFSIESPLGTDGTADTATAPAGTAGTAATPADTEDEAHHQLQFGIGYGLVFGRAESKAIAMSVLDFCLSAPQKNVGDGHGEAQFPTEDQEFVLYHIDGVEATGFISHLKLPHYVTFQSKLNSARRTHDEAKGDTHAAAV